MKKILLIAIFLNTILSSKVIKVDDINGKKIKSEQDFIDLINKNNLEKTIDFIKKKIGIDEDKDKGNLILYKMPGFSVFIPDNYQDKTQERSIFIAMKRTINKSNNPDYEQFTGLNIQENNNAKIISYDNCMHTERQLCYKTLAYEYYKDNYTNKKNLTISDDFINKMKGTLYIFTESPPCIHNTQKNDTKIGCLEYYNQLSKFFSNLKIKLYYPMKKQNKKESNIPNTQTHILKIFNKSFVRDKFSILTNKSEKIELCEKVSIKNLDPLCGLIEILKSIEETQNDWKLDWDTIKTLDTITLFFTNKKIELYQINDQD